MIITNTNEDVSVNVTDNTVTILPYGGNGWTPVLAVVSDGERRVLQVVDWTGGMTTKPATGQFVGPSGFVSTVAAATDISGGSSLPVVLTDVQDGEILTYDQIESAWVNNPLVDGGNF